MVRLNDFNEASKLAFSYMKPGVLTNHVMTADEYRAEIEAGALYAHTWPGGILFLRSRGEYQLLSYYINDAAILPDCELPIDAVTEIAFKPSGLGSAKKAIQFWEQVGLKRALERIRLTRHATSLVGANGVCPLSSSLAPNGKPVAFAMPQDANDCQKLINTSFDPITGHIPTYLEIKASIAESNILCIKDSCGKVCGLLRCVKRVASVEIRQLALREDMRGQGLAHKLLNAFNEKWGSNKSTVWMWDGNVPALKAYTSAGFTADGWRSVVLTF